MTKILACGDIILQKALQDIKAEILNAKLLGIGDLTFTI